MRLSFSVFVPNQQSCWVKGVTGLTETFALSFGAGDAVPTTVKGSFQRTGEGSLPVEGKLVEKPSDAAKRLPKAPTKLSASDKECPICFEEFENEQRPCIETACTFEMGWGRGLEEET